MGVPATTLASLKIFLRYKPVSFLFGAMFLTLFKTTGAVFPPFGFNQNLFVFSAPSSCLFGPYLHCVISFKAYGCLISLVLSEQ